MKKIVCEMCGSNDLLKKDSVFVCQSCGTKYSVEEAKKMMVEGTVDVSGSVNVKNAAQLDNLLKLAYSSFESKNYSQTEKFCNQVIAMDTNNYKAWKLKGEAINFQITIKNPRILEVYNCIMTSYRVLSDKEKEAHKDEIYLSLYTCLKGEIDFVLNQFEAGRPTASMAEKVKSTFTNCLKKINDSLIELEFDEDYIKKQMETLTNYFLLNIQLKCMCSWVQTVNYNYFRDGFTEEYRPSTTILKTYINEGDTLIDLLEFTINYFNDSLEFKYKIGVYDVIITIEELLCKAKSYKRMISTTTNGYGAVTNRYEYWEVDKTLTAEAIKSRQSKITSCRSKIVKLFNKDNKSKKTDELIKLGIEYLKDSEKDKYAKYRFDEVVAREPDLTIGYVGKAICFLIEDNNVACVDNILEASKHEIDEKYRDKIEKLINNFYGDNKLTLLMVASCQYNYGVVKYLIDLGANINARSPKTKVSALWFICSNKISGEHVVAAREVAKLLIDKGANPNVTNIGGVALFNKYTDGEISDMLFDKYPDIEEGAAPKKNSNGCYVATCVYGSYDCPQVWTLRRFRDYTLAETWYGRLFIHTYYAISPTIVKLFGDTKWFKKMWKCKLDKLVNKLQNVGVKNTPYNDRQW